jgi:hypothetical protein
MFTRGEVERLILAHQHVREAIEQSVPRRAASILCKEFKWLPDDKSSFWAGVKDSAEELAKYREKESQVFGNLTALVEDEVSIFARLKIKPQRTREVISDVFNSLISMQDGPSSDNLKVLKGRLEPATKLVARKAKAPSAAVLTGC